MDRYKEKYQRKYCPKCKGTGFIFVVDISGFDTVTPCECVEGKQRLQALTQPKQEETKNDG